ncbi:melatonin receptor type 1B-B-like [Diadema antillarum]|uniref:melatonin receptor type 1B-B-like n=1 Tax=Diadema antillarum TaxID=105358 RepID=UPI003A8489AD
MSLINTTQAADEVEDDDDNIVPRTIFSSFLGFVSVSGFIGNSIVVLAVIIFPKLRTTTNVYIASLAVGDVLMCLTIPWIIVGLLVRDGWPFSPESCVLVAVMRFTCSGGSVWHLATIGFNRMILITTSSATYRKVFSRVNTILILILTWMIPFSVIIVPFAVGATRLGYDDGPHMCSDLEDNDDGTENLTHSYLAATFLTCLPLGIVLMVYLRIFVCIRNHAKQQKSWGASKPQAKGGATTGSTSAAKDAPPAGKEQGTGGDLNEAGTSSNTANATSQKSATGGTNKSRSETSKLENRITKNMFYVVLGFLVCVIPYGIVVLSNPGVAGVPLGQAFLLFNSCVNPLIYGTKHPHFRGAIRNIFRGRFKAPIATSATVAPTSQTT